MRDAVICNPVRTPIGRYGGMFRDVSAVDLAKTVIEALVERSGVQGSVFDDVIFGQCYPNGEAPAIGRVAALEAGLPVEVPGLQLDRRCGSGLQSICFAAMCVQTGASEMVVAGGVESMSQAEFYTTDVRWGVHSPSVQLVDRLARGRVTAGGSQYPVPGGMLETAENVRAMYEIPREEQDAYALRSHQRAVRAQDEGRFDDEIVPVSVRTRDGEINHTKDEHPRSDTTLDKLASLRPIRAFQDPKATVTPGNASGQNDAAAACIVTTHELAKEHGLQALGILKGWAVAGVPPHLMGLGPVPSTEKLLTRHGLALSDIDLIELNEAFAVQVLGVTREWRLEDDDFERVNVNGSGISLGHPVGATGSRIMATLLFEMERRNAEWGVETMCMGGGQGLSALVQRVDL